MSDGYAGVLKRAVRSRHRSLRCRGLASALLLAVPVMFISSGCFRHTIRDFRPKSGQICDQIVIEGTIYSIGKSYVWLNNLPLKHTYDGHNLVADVPEGAVTGPLRVKIDVGGGFVLGVIGTDHTFAEPFVVRGSPSVPGISAFSAKPPTITEGDSSILEWNVGAPLSSLALDGASVLGTTSTSVSPKATHPFHLVATNRCLTRSATITVTVRCKPGFSNCDGKSFNGCESTLRDVANCGACGQKCARAHANVSCAGGICEVVSCAANFADCDRDPANGCETDLRTSAIHCGSCGTACPSNSTCSNRTCTPTSTPPPPCSSYGPCTPQCCPGFECRPPQANCPPSKNKCLPRCARAGEPCGGAAGQCCDHYNLRCELGQCKVNVPPAPLPACP